MTKTKPSYISMKANLVIEFYKSLINYLKGECIIVGEAEKVLELATRAEIKPKFDIDRLRWLDGLKKHLSEGRGFDNQWLCQFFADVFRDLAVIKNPYSMEIFHGLCVVLLGSLRLRVHVVWVEKTKVRRDGSCIHRVHTSHTDSLSLLSVRKGITTPKGTIEEGVVFVD